MDTKQEATTTTTTSMDAKQEATTTTSMDVEPTSTSSKRKRMPEQDVDPQADVETDVDTDVEDVSTKRRKVEKKANKAPRRKVDKITVTFDVIPPMWNTDCVDEKDTAFTVTARGNIENHCELIFREIHLGVQVTHLPASITVRNTPNNMAKVQRIKELIALGRTCVAFTRKESLGRGYTTVTDIQFGRTLAEDLAYVYEFNRKKDNEQKQQQLKQRRSVFREKFLAAPTIESQLAMEQEAIELMTDKYRKDWPLVREKAIQIAIVEQLRLYTNRW